MRILLDTHSFLWFIVDDPKLSARARDVIIDGDNDVLLSIASVWEIAIKVAIGRLPIPTDLEEFIPEQLNKNRIAVLPIQLQHTLAIAGLPLHHRDPFDRMLVVQAISENIPIVSADLTFRQYSVGVLW